MKNIFGKMKKLACLGLAVLTVVSAAGCMKKEIFERQPTEAEKKIIQEKIDKFIEDEDNEAELCKACENAYIDMTFSGTDDEWTNYAVYKNDENYPRAEYTPYVKLRDLIQEKCPFNIAKNSEDKNNSVVINRYQWNEDEKCFEVYVLMNVVDLSIIKNTLFTEEDIVFDDKKLDPWEGYSFKDGTTLQANLTGSADDQVKAVCAFIISYLDRFQPNDILELAQVRTELCFKVEEKNKWEIKGDFDTIKNDVKEQINSKFDTALTVTE